VIVLARPLLLCALALALPQGLAAQTAAVQVVPGERIVARALAALVDRSAGVEGSLEWEPVGIAPDSRIPEGHYELRVGEMHGAWPRRRIGVPVQLWVDGRLAQSRVIWFSGHWWREALVYAQDAKAGQHAHPELARRQRTDSAGIEIIGSEDMGWIEGLRLKKPVRAGQPVHRSDFENVPMVARNDRVRVAVKVGGVHLQTTGVAGEEGAVDDLIRVLPQGAERSVLARVVARNEVKIEH